MANLIQDFKNMRTILIKYFLEIKFMV